MKQLRIAAFAGKNKDFRTYLKIMRTWLDKGEVKTKHKKAASQ